MAHPARAGLVVALIAKLDHSCTVAFDRGLGVAETGRRALASYDPRADFHVVLQDDVLIPRDLMAGLARALDHVPPRTPVGLYVGSTGIADIAVAAKRATRAGASWLVLPCVVWGPGLAIPTELMPDLLDCYDRFENLPPWYDKRLALFCRKRELVGWHTWPSLVEHRDSPSLMGKNKVRHAARFVGAETSALDLSWDGPVLRWPG